MESLVNEDISGSNVSWMALKAGDTKVVIKWDALVIICANGDEVRPEVGNAVKLKR